MDNEYKGISFPFRIGGRGGVASSGRTNSTQHHVKECLLVLLGSKEAERVMRPYNGLAELDVLFNNLNETTKNMIVFKVTEKIQEFEPRVSVVSIDVAEEILFDDSRAFVITVIYRENDTGNVESVSINF